MNIIARGAGQAVLQMDYSYGIDWDPLKDVPPVDAYELDVHEIYHNFRNKSLITVELCPRYMRIP